MMWLAVVFTSREFRPGPVLMVSNKMAIDVQSFEIVYFALSWVTHNLSGTYPQNNAGNPSIGNFPVAKQFNQDDNVQYTTLTILLSDLSIEQCCLGSEFDDIIYQMMSHASLFQRDASGLVTSGQTAWSEGAEVNNGGSWASVSKYHGI